VKDRSERVTAGASATLPAEREIESSRDMNPGTSTSPKVTRVSDDHRRQRVPGRWLARLALQPSAESAAEDDS
jgi:hypothetical protein